MSDILIRNLSATTIEKLKARAKSMDRSVQAELKAIVEQAVNRPTLAAAKDMALQIRRQLADRSHSDSVELLAEDRQR